MPSKTYPKEIFIAPEYEKNNPKDTWLMPYETVNDSEDGDEVAVYKFSHVVKIKKTTAAEVIKK